MARANILDIELLCRAHPADIARHILDLIAQHDEQEISRQLLQAVETERIRPIVLSVWLPAARTFGPVKDALLQNFSACGRQFACKDVGRRLRSGDWETVWDGLGGTTGIVELMSNLPAQDAGSLARFMEVSFKYRDERKQELFTQLFETLKQDPTHAAYRSRLLPCCTDECVQANISLDKKLPSRQLPFSHTALLQKMYLNAVEHESLQNEKKSYDDIRSLCMDVSSTIDPATHATGSTQFALSLLRLSVVERDSNHVLDRVLDEVIATLAQRVLKKYAVWSDAHEFLELCVSYFEQHGRKSSGPSTPEKSFFFDTLRCWDDRRGRLSVDQLRAIGVLMATMLKFYYRKQTQDAVAYSEVLSKVSCRKRYELFQIAIESHLGVDIEQIESLLAAGSITLECDVLFLLEKDQAVPLLERWMKAKPHCKFLRGWIDTNTDHPPAQEKDVQYTDCNLVLTRLYRGSSTGVELALKNIKNLKTGAIASRDQEDRARYVKSVVWYATASHSLAIFEETVVWVKRYLRDPLTVRELYQDDCMASDEVVKLLSALPITHHPYPDDVDLGSIEAGILHANKILMTLFGTIVEALKEPWFRLWDWTAVLGLFEKVALFRIKHCVRMDKDTSIFKETLRLLLDLESRILYVGSDDLSGHFGTKGPLRMVSIYTDEMFPRPSESLLIFIDELARNRDELWREYRKSHDPDTALLRSPYPQGLPLHDLWTGINKNSEWKSDFVPYLNSRAKAVAMMDRDVALSTLPDDMALNVIGKFVESLDLAIEYSIWRDDISLSGRQNRAGTIWSHWIAILCHDNQLTTTEAAQFLRENKNLTCFGEKFQTMMKGIDSTTILGWQESKFDPYPKLPKNGSSSAGTAWNPAAEEPKKNFRLMKPTCLDYHLLQAQNKRAYDEEFVTPSQRIVSQVAPAFFDVDRIFSSVKNPSSDIIDGMILACLLFIDCRSEREDRKASNLFVSSANSRFPIWDLDPEFVKRKDLKTESAVVALRKFKKDIPSTLLARIVEAQFEILLKLPSDSPGFAHIERTVFYLLKILAQSDRPHLACQYIFQIVIDQPDASSWHRQFLTPKFMTRLRPQQVEGFLSKLSIEILSRLRSQSQPNKQPSKSSTEHTQLPYIKVTTAKLLVQLLTSLDFVPTSILLSVLSGFLKQSCHIDIQVAVVESLMNLLSKNHVDDDSSTEQILTTLELILPTISAFNERKPMSEAEWQDAEARSFIPEPSPPHKPALISTLTGLKLPKDVKQSLFDRILRPAMATSIAANQRWIKLVTEKYDCGFDFVQFAIPFNFQTFTGLLSEYFTSMTESDLEMYHAFMMATIDPPLALREMNSQFRSSNRLSESPEGRYWARNLGLGMLAIDSPQNCFNPVHHFTTKQEDIEFSSAHGISIEHVQRCYCEQAVAILARQTKADHDITFNAWHRFTQNLRLEPSKHDQRSSNSKVAADGQAGVKYALPVIQKLIAHITSLRTPQWQRDPNRAPVLLPSTLDLRITVLPWPFMIPRNQWTPMITEEKHQIYVKFASSILDLFTNTIVEFTMTDKTVTDTVVVSLLKSNNEDLLRTSLGFASLSLSESTFEKKMKAVEMAATLIKKSISKREDQELRDKVSEVVKGWLSSEVEMVRVYGFQTVLELKDGKQEVGEGVGSWGMDDDQNNDDDFDDLRWSI